MKRLFFLLLVIVALVGCYPSTQITGSWKNPKQQDKNYTTLFIAALTGNNIAKSTIENDLQAELSKHGVKTTKSMDEFPPNFSNDSIPKEEMMKRVKKNGEEAILTVSLLKKETESRYV